jgi:DNA-binding MarR family transcriptional regulator
MRTETDELADRFWRVLEESFKRVADQQKRAPLPAYRHLNDNQIRAMHLLHNKPGMVQKELAETMGITPAAVSTAVKEMTTLGLVDRHPDPEDARLSRLYLSEEARCKIGEMRTIRLQAVTGLLESLPLEEQRMIVEALERAMLKAPTGNIGPPV